MNITPNSFSDGGDLSSPDKIIQRLKGFGDIDVLDIGAESTASMNGPITWEEEWERLQLILPILKDLSVPISLDTYHPETIHEMVRWWRDQNMQQELFWNDVSGKFDHWVWAFIKESKKFHYIFCHNLAPSRETTGQHMDYVLSELKLSQYFAGFEHPQVLFDPCLGFSKSYGQNWWILENFNQVQKEINHNRWVLGFSRKSFLRGKFGLSLENKEELDQVHVSELQRLIQRWQGEVWIRTHRPDLL